tara:strand:+ start:1050 stop:2270 length:1221 start_codon:yes stop_codon:yes gene_type:complete
MNKNPLKKNQIISLLKKISIKKLKNEKIDLLKSEGRILSSDIVSSINLPPFNNSAVDGYALHKDNLQGNIRLKCSYRIAAGDRKNISLKSGEVAKIFTGASMPLNSNTVIMQENTREVNHYIYPIKTSRKGENCRLAGEDITKGSKILKSGDKIKSTNLNLIAAIGKKTVLVKEKIKIGYYTSGNELQEPSEKIINSKINNSNRYSLCSLLNNNFIKSKYLGVLKDSKKNILNQFNKNLKNHNIIITAGGASVGEEDHLISILKEKGRIFFWKAAIKPGRPIAVGKIKETIIICLPGNPVSVHLLFGMLIKPFLEFLCGSKFILPIKLKATINFNMKKKTERMEWLRVIIESKKNKSIHLDKYSKQGSGMISSLAYSDGIIEIPEEVNQINVGDVLDFYPFENIFN